MTESWVLAKIVIAFMGGGFAGIVLGAFLAASKRAEECSECRFVKFYCAKCKDAIEGQLNWPSDELKRPSAKMG
jgi:hypothetical protein